MKKTIEKKENKVMQNPVFLNPEDGMWYFYEKFLTTEKQIIYRVHPDGYAEPEAAMQAYLSSAETFRGMMDALKVNVERQSFADAIQNWYHNTLTEVSANSYVVSTAYVVYHFLLPNMEKIGEKPLAKVNHAELNKLIEQTNELCESAQWQTYRTLKSFFSDMYLSGAVKTNPMDQVAPRRMPRERAEVPPYTLEDVKTLLHYAKGNANFLEICLCLHGLRTGEVRGLKFSDFDRENGTLAIRRQAVRRYEASMNGDVQVAVHREDVEIKATKTYESHRTIRISPILFDLVDERRELLAQWKETRLAKKQPWDERYDEYLCVSKFGTIKSDGTVSNALKRVCASAGLPIISPHDLRHITATLMFEYGTRDSEHPDQILKTVADYLGHANTGTTFDIYTAYLDRLSRIRDIAEQTDPFFHADEMRGEADAQA